MKYCRIPSLLTAAFGVLGLGPTHAAFIIEANGTLGSSNFAYTGDGGTAASPSTTSEGNLPATTDPTPTFFTLGHVFGGNGTTDQYTFTYTPVSDVDNVSFSIGTTYNLPQGLASTGLAGGSAGNYNVYRIHPNTDNVSGGATNYEVFVNGVSQTTESIDQNADNLATGVNIGRWELIGSVAVPSASDVVTVEMTATNATFTSMRASGIMFEYVSPIPEPGSAVLFVLGSLLLFQRRRN